MPDVTMVTLQASGQTLWLLPERAIFLPDSDTLIVADAHVGTNDDTLAVLSGLVRKLEATRIVFLGDFLHAARSEPATMAAIVRWRERHSALELTLIRSPLDPPIVEPPAMLDIQAFDEPVMHRGIAMCHRPQPIRGAFVLAGHVSPCVSIRGRARDRPRMPCFWFSLRQCVLPAFGTSTEMQSIKPTRGQRIFAAANGRVVELQPRPKPPSAG
ncbi:MAG: DEAD/DEAH box helicase [Burkholderiales bacterium]